MKFRGKFLLKFHFGDPSPLIIGGAKVQGKEEGNGGGGFGAVGRRIRSEVGGFGRGQTHRRGDMSGRLWRSASVSFGFSANEKTAFISFDFRFLRFQLLFWLERSLRIEEEE